MEDSLLAVLGMFEDLTWSIGRKEQMVTVMEAALGPKITTFLTPESDRYADLVSGDSIARPSMPWPREELSTRLDRKPGRLTGW